MDHSWPRGALAVVIATSTALSLPGCATRRMTRRPGGEYISEPPGQSEIVRVRAVLTKLGERVEFPERNPALLIGNRVMSFRQDARVITARRRDAEVLTEGTETVEIRSRDRTYNDVLVVAKTPDSIVFVAHASSLEREIPLEDIDELWVQTKSPHVAVAALILGAIVLGALAIVAAFTLGDVS